MEKYNNQIYSIEIAFEEIEDELISSMIRNMEHHKAQEVAEGIEWEQWQVLQLKALEDYKKKATKKYGKRFKDINSTIDGLIRIARKEGNLEQEEAILKAIKRGHKSSKLNDGISGSFFKLNDRKMDALVEAAYNDFTKAEYAMLRQANDQYRQIIYNAQVYANSGVATYRKAVDMATRDYLRKGITCIEYKNGARHTIESYSQMYLRTSTTRAYAIGEGEKRMEWGEHLVVMKKRPNACPKCIKFGGKILIDDVWSGGSRSDGPYMLMSQAIEQKLYHPNCKDIHVTYFPDIEDLEDDGGYTRRESIKLVENYNAEQREKYRERQEKSYERLEKYSLDEENKKKYGNLKKKWRKK